ncbi:alpha/beta hydrolase [Flavobacterium sp. NRK F10]|uniref:alpha/beta hydrolase n=1 Tax=Flavobacterium sp. NRK F10 TaxID=2954931 RepID=UPI0020904D14|nr:alpha/beta hydrolase [Flavobacterium sp. NRK F10]
MNKILKNMVLLFCLVLTNGLTAQVTEVALWEGKIPNAISNSKYTEIQTIKDSVLVKVSQVVKPTLTIFKPKSPNGTAVIICPGGGYAHLSIDKEGYKVAKWLNTLSITAIVLKYRLPSDAIMKDKTIGPLQDAQEAMRYARRHAKELNIQEDKIGILGFSAGGHLASTLATHYRDMVYNITDSVSAKPDFSILIYPVISMEEGITHQGSRNNLLGCSPSIDTVEYFSNEKNTDTSTPITFIVHATDDKAVPVENSINYYRKLKANHVSVELHLYEKGGHGFGLGKVATSLFWTKQCEIWLQTNNFKE